MLPPCNFYWFRIDTKHITEPWLDQTLMDLAYNHTRVTLWTLVLLTYTFVIKSYNWNRSKFYFKNQSSMPSPLAPDPIRVQPCVWCLFWTNRNCMAVTSDYLAHYPIRDKSLYQRYNSLNGNIYFFWN